MSDVDKAMDIIDRHKLGADLTAHEVAWAGNFLSSYSAAEGAAEARFEIAMLNAGRVLIPSGSRPLGAFQALGRVSSFVALSVPNSAYEFDCLHPKAKRPRRGVRHPGRFYPSDATNE